MKLYPHQEKAVNETPAKWGLWFKMRVGKTATAIRLAEKHAMSALIICPKSIKKQWEKEVETWKLKCEFEVWSREQFRINYKKIKRHDAIVVDEVHTAGGNYKSQFFKALEAYIDHHAVRYIWPLTGTPYTGNPWCVYSYARLLGRKWDWYKFKMTFFDEVRLGRAPAPGQRDLRKRITVPKKGMEARLQELLRSLGTVIDLKDITEVMDDEDMVENISFGKEQKKLSDDFYDENPIVNFTRQHQIESGCLKSDGYVKDIKIRCPKDDRIVEICSNTDKVVIVCKYLLQIEKYVELLKLLGVPIFTIHGQQKEMASEVAAKAEQEERAIVIVQGDMGCGYSLASFDTMIFASMSFSFVSFDQVKSRMKAIGKKIANCYIHLITEGKNSIDRAVYESVKRKENFSIELYNNNNI